MSTIPGFVMTTPATILRAPLANVDGYGPQRDWGNATATPVQVCIYPEALPSSQSESGAFSDKEFSTMNWALIAPPGLDLLSTDRVTFDPGNGTITCEVNGDPFPWHGPGPAGVIHHVEAKLKIVRGA